MIPQPEMHLLIRKKVVRCMTCKVIELEKKSDFLRFCTSSSPSLFIHFFYLAGIGVYGAQTEILLKSHILVHL